MRRTLPFSFLILLLGASCAKPTPTPLPPGEIIVQATARMKSLSSFHFIIERTGAPAYIDTNNTLALGRAEGDFSSPDKAKGQVRIVATGIVVSFKFTSLGDRYWQTNPLSRKWEEYPTGTFFNPAELFDSEIGLQPILETDLYDLVLEGNKELEEMPGKLLYSITGQLQGARLYQLSWGMIGPDAMGAHLWVDPATFDLHRIELVEAAAEGGEPTLWKFDFLDFNKPVDIQPPTSSAQ
jgi:hypothetical protein